MRALRTAAGALEFSGSEPWLMATVTPGPGAVERAVGAKGAGARIIGIREGGARPELIRRLGDELEVPLAVVTGTARDAELGLAAGATIVDASGGIESPGLAELCARHGAGLIVPVGTPAAATGALPEAARMHAAGAGFALDAVGDWLLLLHAESPELPLELAAVARGIELGASVLAVSDVGAAADFLAVQGVLYGRREIDPDLRLPPGLRREPAGAADAAGTAVAADAAGAEGAVDAAGVVHPPI